MKNILSMMLLSILSLSIGFQALAANTASPSKNKKAPSSQTHEFVKKVPSYLFEFVKKVPSYLLARPPEKETNPTGCVDTDKKDTAKAGKVVSSTQWRYAGEKKWRETKTEASVDSCADPKKVVEYSCDGRKLVKQTVNCPKGCQAGKCLPSPGDKPSVTPPNLRDMARTENIMRELDPMGLVSDRTSGIITMPGWKPGTVMGALMDHLNLIGNRANLLIGFDDLNSNSFGQSGSSQPPPGMTIANFVGSRNLGFYMSGNHGYGLARSNAEYRMANLARGEYTVDEEIVSTNDGITTVFLVGHSPDGTQYITSGGSNEDFPPDSSAGTKKRGSDQQIYAPGETSNLGTKKTVFRCVDPNGCAQTHENGVTTTEGEWVKDTGCEGMTCPEGHQCNGGRCEETAEAATKCEGVTCDEAEECVNGQCKSKERDKCEGVTCPEGKTCKDGSCVGTSDGDGEDSSDDSQCPPEVDGCSSQGGGIDPNDPQVQQLMGMLGNCTSPGMVAATQCGPEGCSFFCSRAGKGTVDFLNNPKVIRQILCPENDTECNKRGANGEGRAPRNPAAGWTDPHPEPD